MKRTIPAGRIAFSVWFAVAVILAAVMSLCANCGTVPTAAANASCSAIR